MEESTIGIKIADGTYYPVMGRSDSKKKKLILTTVNDDQESVQIDLYEGEGEALTDAKYVGSLVIEDIKPSAKKEPSIELIVGVDDEGNLNAQAGDMATGDRQSLSVSLKSLEEKDFTTPDFEIDEDSMFGDIPEPEEEDSIDFSFDDDELDTSGLDEDVFGSDSEEPLSEDFDSGFDTEADTDFDDDFSFDDDADALSAGSFDTEEPDSDTFESDEPEDEEDKPFQYEGFPDDYYSSEEDETEEDSAPVKEKKSPVLLIVIILILLILGIGAFLFLRNSGGEAVPPLEAGTEQTVQETDKTAEAEKPEAAEPAYTEPEKTEPEIVVKEEPKVPAAEKAPEPEKTVVQDTAPSTAKRTSSDGVPPVGSGGGVWYRLKWGDNLWNLSISFYRTPWLYGIIAETNRIKNPDLIYAGTDIFIPEN